MIKYGQIFLSKIKSLLFYFVKFCNNRSILSKVYLDNSIIKDLDQRFIIITICNKNIFFINNGYQKI